MCPAGYYYSNNTVNCVKCNPECELCNSKNECQFCAEGYYLHNKSACVNSCPNNYYKNNINRECSKCSEGCIECYGPTNKECISCNYIKGYGFLSPNSRECARILCKESEFLELANDQLICSKCYETCKSCINGLKDGCIECNKGFVPFKQKNNQTSMGSASFECSTCEKFIIGYFTDENGNCKGIFVFEKIKQRNLWRWA